ncbi:MAG: DnaJ domain-containing protein [Hespellia sp.]|nr:DnaJ domain-containing protein [Hespellia sp.]
MEIWDILQIEPTKDKRQIKKAYAKMIAMYHPEEHPEQFQEIHTAYEIALRLAEDEEEKTFLHENETTAFVENENQNEDIFGENENQREEPSWIMPEEIQKRAKKYALINEREKNRERLTGAFLEDLAMEKLNEVIQEGKVQSHDCWIQYFKDPIVIQAIKLPSFLKRFTDKITGLSFEKVTLQMMEQMIQADMLPAFSNKKKLCSFLKKDGYKKIQKRIWKKRCIIAASVLIAVWGVVGITFAYQSAKERRAREVFRAPEKIQEYISDKYKIDCQVTYDPSYGLAAIGFGDNVPHGDPYENYEVQTDASGDIPDTFELAWSKDSVSYEDIVDNYSDEVLKLYAKECDISLSVSMRHKVEFYDISLDEYKPKLLAFLGGVQNSTYVQSGHDITLTVGPSLTSRSDFEITISKDQELDPAVIAIQLEQCESNALIK